MRPALVIGLAWFLLAACGGGAPGSADRESSGAGTVCGGFGDWKTSPFKLPYPVGQTYRVNQANCSGFGHSDFWTYGYDFEMPIGTVVTASRDGVVAQARDGARDGDRQRTNLITIEHDDGTVALYSHLTLNGVHVTIGQAVQAGDVIGQSGDTGNTGGLPHLHFSLHPCGALPGLPGTGQCDSIPVNFSNTEPNPDGLTAGRAYTAEPF